jgi:hypothetical protein
MALSKMIVAFIALGNEEARYVCDLLVKAGIKAKVMEPFDPRPEVWIDQVDADRAKPVLADYLRRGAHRRMARWRAPGITERADAWYAAQKSKGLLTTSEASIEVTCEECGKWTKFPAVLRGTAEVCPHCGATIDVGDNSDFE